MEKTIEDMHKTFLEFKDRAIASGIQKGAPSLAGHLKATAERLGELAKNSTEESDAEEDENDHGRPVQSAAIEPRSRQQRREGGPESASMLGYQATFGEEEEEEEEDAGEIAAPSAQFELENRLPLSGWTGTENMQQLRNKGRESRTQSLNNTRPVPYQQKWVDVLDDGIEQFLRSKGLYRDGRYSVPFYAVDSSLGSEETPLPTVNPPYHSPSLTSSEGPHTPESMNVHWPNETYASRNHKFLNESQKIWKAPDLDTSYSFDDASIHL